MPTVTVNGTATPTPEVAAHVDLAAGVITEIRFTTEPAAPGPLPSRAVLEVEVVVHSSTAPVWLTVDGTDPAVRGPRSFVIPAAPASDLRTPATFRPSVVKLLSAAAAVVSVQAVR
ncbi:hypothetical protein WDZ16_12890 [Pseudokineococcus marinus]|uniref:Uncharacterized protein n=1 Tax=Pseudokineococcus marinus TaxID=351215 RepID=A0A849BGD6_9ACTN|nr:hypothetical protein [Pseudokineococcus marinus]NNH21631.1 hypothetical protein [Pseudokineococcus marinus]